MRILANLPAAVSGVLTHMGLNLPALLRMEQMDEARNKPKTKLESARVLLADTDYKIISLLKEFEPAAGKVTNPSSAYLNSYLGENPLPQDVQDMIIATNTPTELVATVAQHISRKSRAEKVNKFKALAEAVCERHTHTRLVAEHKMEDPTTPRDEDNNVVTFVDWQHKNVEQRAVAFATQVGNTRNEPVMDPKEIDLDTVTDKFEKFALGVVSDLAYAGASIQYDIINKHGGREPTNASYDINYNLKPAVT